MVLSFFRVRNIVGVDFDASGAGDDKWFRWMRTAMERLISTNSARA